MPSSRIHKLLSGVPKIVVERAPKDAVDGVATVAVKRCPHIAVGKASAVAAEGFKGGSKDAVEQSPKGAVE